VQTDFPSTPSSSGGRRPPPWPALTLALLAATVAGASLTGCMGTPSRNKDVLRRTQPPQPILTETAVYGGGALTVECWLGPTVRLKKTDDKAEPGHQADHGGRPLAESDATASSRGERFGGPFERGASNYSSQEIDEMYGRINYERVLPPRLALALRFINPGARPVTFTIADVNSTLGDFAPRPETLTVAPGQLGSVDPMLSNSDDDFEELDVTVAIKIGGKTETQILHLHPSQEPLRRD
jgi:hypothetical protein